MAEAYNWVQDLFGPWALPAPKRVRRSKPRLRLVTTMPPQFKTARRCRKATKRSVRSVAFNPLTVRWLRARCIACGVCPDMVRVALER